MATEPPRDFTYNEKDLLDWTNRRLREVFNGMVLCDNNSIRAVANNCTAEGEAFASSAKGTRHKGKAHSAIVFNLQIEIKFYGRVFIGDSTIGSASGLIRCREVSYDVLASPEGWELEVKLDEEMIPAALRPPDESRGLCETDEAIKGLVQRNGVDAARAALLVVLKELSNLGGDAADPPAEEVEDLTSTPSSDSSDSADATKVKELTKDLRRMMLGKKFLSVVGGEQDTDVHWHLAMSSIEDGEVEELLEPLKRNQALKELDLSMNKIGNAGVNKLCSALQTHQTLETLDLRRNNVGTAGVQALVAMLAVGGAPALRCVKLANNDAIDKITGETMVNGLTLMRKGVEVLFEDPSFHL